MKVYVAGKWSDKYSIREIMDRVEKMGGEITYDWTKNISTKCHEKLGESAKLDINGVVKADYVIFIMTDPNYPYRGTFTELGAALATGKTIFLYCPDESSYCVTNCFFHHPGIIRVESIQEIYEHLAEDECIKDY